MDPIERKRAVRFLVLQSLYERSGGNPHKYVHHRGFGEALGLDAEEADDALHYLEREGLVEYPVFESVAITHRGVKQVEDVRSTPNRPTRYFPPYVNIISVQNMTNSQIQQGSHGSTQSQTITGADLEQVRAFVAMLKAEMPKVGLPADAEADAIADVATVEAQLSASRPKAGIVLESLRSVRTVLEGTAGNVLATQLLTHFPAIMQMLARVGHHLG